YSSREERYHFLRSGETGRGGFVEGIEDKIDSGVRSGSGPFRETLSNISALPFGGGQRHASAGCLFNQRYSGDRGRYSAGEVVEGQVALVLIADIQGSNNQIAVYDEVCSLILEGQVRIGSVDCPGKGRCGGPEIKVEFPGIGRGIEDDSGIRTALRGGEIQAGVSYSAASSSAKKRTVGEDDGDARGPIDGAGVGGGGGFRVVVDARQQSPA